MLNFLLHTQWCQIAPIFPVNNEQGIVKSVVVCSLSVMLQGSDNEQRHYSLFTVNCSFVKCFSLLFAIAFLTRGKIGISLFEQGFCNFA